MKMMKMLTMKVLMKMMPKTKVMLKQRLFRIKIPSQLVRFKKKTSMTMPMLKKMILKLVTLLKKTLTIMHWCKLMMKTSMMTKFKLCLKMEVMKLLTQKVRINLPLAKRLK